MLFLTGPRQTGKTTLAKTLAETYPHRHYFNWDNVIDQKTLISDPYFFTQLSASKTQKACLVYDEIHKFSDWKNYIKGVWDSYHDLFDIIISGSGRLDLFKRGKDSLLGRYLQLIVFPFTLGELLKKCTPSNAVTTALDEGVDESPIEAREYFDRLLKMGGFPDPYVKDDPVFTKNWRHERHALVINDDVRQMAQIRELSQLQILAHLLPERVGSPLSLNALREDVGIAFETARDWVSLLEKVFFCFRIYPYAQKIQRVIRKEAKLYLFDYSGLDNNGARFENLMALHCLKAVDVWNRTEADEFGLHYVRDKSKRETDFLIIKNKKPWLLIETKTGSTSWDSSLVFYQEVLKCPHAIQVLATPGIYRREKTPVGVRVLISVERFLPLLP